MGDTEGDDISDGITDGSYQNSFGTDIAVKQNEEVYTYKEAIEACGFGHYQYVIFWVTSAVWAADAVEIMLLGFLIPELKNKWDLSDVAAGSVAASVFFGMMIGAYGFANASDQIGRRPCLIFALLCCAVFGSLSAVAPNLFWIIFFRTGVGFGVGGSSCAFVLFTELVPQKTRARALLLQQFLWAFGSIFCVALAWIFIPCCGWRYFVFFCSFPLWILLMFSSFIPESPRFLLTQGDVEGAIAGLSTIAAANNCSLPNGRLLQETRQKSHGKLAKMFLPYYRKTSLLLLFIFFANVFCYYGICFLSVTTLTEDDGNDDDGVDSDQYWQIFVTTLSEIPGILVGLLLLDWIGRTGTMSVCWLQFFICGLFLSLGHMKAGEFETVVLIFIARAGVALGFLTVYIYFSEFYPTPIRNTALGFASSLGRIAAMSVSFGVETLPDETAFALLTGFAGAALVATLILPYDTIRIDQTDKLIGDESYSETEKTSILHHEKP